MSRPSTPIGVAIDPDRLLGDLRRLRAFGAWGIGVVRPSLSPIDMESRHWLRARMEEAGLDARIDGIGTVFGRSRNPAPSFPRRRESISITAAANTFLGCLPARRRSDPGGFGLAPCSLMGGLR